MKKLEQLTTQLWREPLRFSRNRNHEMHQGDLARQARAHVRLLRSIQMDLRSASAVKLQNEGESFCLVIRLDKIDGHRQVFLSPFLLKLLLEDPGVRKRISDDHQLV